MVKSSVQLTSTDQWPSVDHRNYHMLKSMACLNCLLPFSLSLALGEQVGDTLIGDLKHALHVARYFSAPPITSTWWQNKRVNNAVWRSRMSCQRLEVHVSALCSLCREMARTRARRGSKRRLLLQRAEMMYYVTQSPRGS